MKDDSGIERSFQIRLRFRPLFQNGQKIPKKQNPQDS
jgi:hypothetical protein